MGSCETDFLCTLKEAIWSLLVTKKKQGNKKEELTESIQLTVKIALGGRITTLVSETLHKQNHCQNHKAPLNEKPTDSP